MADPVTLISPISEIRLIIGAGSENVLKTVLTVTIDRELFKEIERLKEGNRSALVEQLLRLGLRSYVRRGTGTRRG